MAGRSKPAPIPCDDEKRFTAAVSTLRTRGFIVRNEIREAFLAAAVNLAGEDADELRLACETAEHALDQIYTLAVRLGIKHGI